MIPKISVIIPAYNAEKYIIETLSSIQKQTLKPHEVIVVNDASKDSTVEAVMGFRARDGLNIRIYHNGKNMGIGYTRQRGAMLATGDYVSFLSSDDVWHPRFLEECSSFLQPDCAVYSDYYRCNETLQPFAYFQSPDPSRENIIEWALKKNMFICFSCLIFPRNIFNYTSFMNKLRHGEDLIFLLDTVINGLTFIRVPKPLMYYRTHSLQGSQTEKQNRNEFESLWAALFMRLHLLEISKEKIEKAYLISHKSVFPSPFNLFLRKMKTGARKLKSQALP